MTDPTAPLSSPAISRRGLLAGSGALGAGALGVGSLVGAGSASSTTAHPRRSAATVIVNGRVISGTGNHHAQAVAVGRNGRILHVGRNADVIRMIGRDTDVVDAAGGTVISGIHDGHVHPLYAGLASLNPSLEDASLTIPELQAILTSFLDGSSEQEPDGWLVVQAWNPAGLLPTGTVAHRDFLDVLPTARPIALKGSDGHNLWANSRALAVAGIDSSTPDPPGGEIVTDANGPTGLLKDSAQELVSAVIPEPSYDVQLTAMSDALAFMAASGITSYTDAWVDEGLLLGPYRDLVARDAVRQRTIASLLVPEELIGSPADAVAWAQALAASNDDLGLVRLGTVKIFMDGVIEYPAQTAALLEPYLEADGTPTDYYGELYVDGPTMDAFATAFDAAGWQIHAHAIGDAAVRGALDGYQAARRANRHRAHRRRHNRHTIAHLQLVHPDDYPRFARLGVIPDMQLQWASRNIYTLDALEPFIGAERHRRMYPARSILRAGGALAGGSDWPVDTLFPWNQVETAVNRMGLYGDGTPLHAEQGISLRQSLRMHTLGTARQMHQERQTGTLQQGKLADLVVLDRDLTRIPVTEIRETQVQLTLLGGEATFEAASSEGRALQRRAARSQGAASLVTKLSHSAVTGRHTGCPCSRAR